MASQELRDALFIASDQRSNFKQIIAKRSDLVQFDRGRLGPSTYGTTLVAGTVLGLATSGGDSGFYKAYASGNSDGSQTAVAVLSEDATSDALGQGSEIVMIREADLFQALLIGLDSGAITALNGKSYSEGGNQLIRIRA